MRRERLARDACTLKGVNAIPAAMAAPVTAWWNRGSRAVLATAEQADCADVGDKWAAGNSCVPAT